jgi:hypothetical protein
MTVLPLAPHDLVHVRATVIEVYDASCLLGLPIHRHSANGQHRIVLPFSEIVKRDITVIAWEAMRVISAAALAPLAPGSPAAPRSENRAVQKGGWRRSVTPCCFWNAAISASSLK